MLPPFIIEQIRKREEEERQRQDADRPRVELPIPMGSPPSSSHDATPDDEEVERGVVILDM
ncbi:MAG TPA: hypothetical protein VHO25_21455 [Polyangiaceae bacterium]|nr:hypothetical protein [Polyangiaceae bacterium]